MRKPAPAAPAEAPAGAEQPPAPPAGQAAPSSVDQEYRAPAGGTTTLGGEAQHKKAEVFTTVAQAQAALDRANRELASLYQPAAGGAGKAPAAADSTTTATGSAPTPMKDKEIRCATACKAFASLKRAADAVCRLAGDDDARCDHARKLVEENGQRVAQCGCRDGG